LSEIELEIANGVGIVTLAAPARRNALTAEMAMALAKACDRVDEDPTVGAVVFRGGPFFCAGAHRDRLLAASSDPAGAAAFEGLGAIYRSLARVSELQVPSIAAVRGGAVGAGVNLLLSATIRIIGTGATITSGFARLGIHPGGGHLALLNRAGGYEAAAALGLFSETITGTQAASLGLAWEAVADNRVEDRAIEVARHAGADPLLSRMVLRSFRLEVGPPTLSLGVALELERGAQMRTLRRRSELYREPLAGSHSDAR
jgi:enoyl-CoA hydratase